MTQSSQSGIDGGWTKGPWLVDLHGFEQHGGRAYAHVWSAGDKRMQIGAVILGAEGCSQDEGRANARLIAAAPNLYYALDAAIRGLRFYDAGSGIYRATIEAGEQALRKALPPQTDENDGE